MDILLLLFGFVIGFGLVFAVCLAMVAVLDKKGW